MTAGFIFFNPPYTFYNLHRISAAFVGRVEHRETRRVQIPADFMAFNPPYKLHNVRS